MEKKEKFVIPEAEIINFCDDDIITNSGEMTILNEDEVIGG